MKHPFLLFLRHIVLFNTLLLCFQQGAAQYYYHDIVLTEQNRQQQQLYKKNRVTGVKLLSYEANGLPAEDFTCEVSLNNDFTQIKTFTKSGLADASLLTALYNAEGQLFRSTDSSKESVNKYEYSYDNAGRLVMANNTSAGSGNNMQQKETHQWKYNSNGCPETMLRIRNDTDTTIVKLLCDEQGNITEEESWRRTLSQEKIYYYYDNSHRLTDVVRYNTKLGRLLPDYMFEYNGEGQLTQMTAVQQGANDYLIWQYEYAANGLKTKATCLNKQKRPVGRIEYQYSTPPAQQ
jgi:YD repeat-containing protein